MALRKPSPVHLAYSAIGGATLAASTWFVPFLPVMQHEVRGHGLLLLLWSDRLEIFLFLAPLVLGGLIWWKAYGRFRDTYLADVWNEEELASVRALFEHPFWKVAGLGVVLACVAFIVFISMDFGHHTHSPNGAMSYLLTLPLSAVSQMKRLIAPPTSARGPMGLWKDFKPIQSDHWGEQQSG